MTDLSSARIAVVGAGSVGSAVALHLAWAGAEVLLADPALVGDNASGVAAGMLAPALEAALDPAAAGRFSLLRAARDLWPFFVERLDAPEILDRSGALWIGDAAGRADRLAVLRAMGAAAETVTDTQAAALSPGVAAAGGGLFTPEDWRIDPPALLLTLRRAFLRAGGRVAQRAAVQAGLGWVMLDDGERRPVDWTVYAGGHPSSLTVRLAPELARLSPIKGQILRFAPGVAPEGGPIVRSSAVYVAPGPGGPAAGATMEEGRDDRRADPAVAETLRSAAAALFPTLADARGQGLAGVRTAAPDGLPLVGVSAAEGVLLATGARRNGWLLAPLIAQAVTAVAGGRAPGAAGALFDPARLGR